jgi:glycosyltransferase involved in cell wall biosynthesis
VPNHHKKLLKKIRQNNYDLIYANTIATSDLLYAILNQLRVPVILHVHELEMGIKLYCDPGLFKKIMDKITYFVVVSKIVQENLIQQHQIHPDKIHLVHAFACAPWEIRKIKEAITIELHIPPGAFIVGGCGWIEWRKGVDLFVQVAHSVLKAEQSGKPIYFIWLGNASPIELYKIKYDIRSLGLTTKIILIPNSETPADYFNLFDLFLLPSREDPFPLVCVENALMGNPVVCFDKNVGSTEFIDNTCGAVVPYLDLVKMSEAVLSFYEQPDLLAQAGENIKKRASEFTVEQQGPKILEVIQQLITPSVTDLSQPSEQKEAA